jgi:hypothetical protein
MTSHSEITLTEGEIKNKKQLTSLILFLIEDFHKNTDVAIKKIDIYWSNIGSSYEIMSINYEMT